MEIRNSNTTGGKGLFATQSYEKNTVIFILNGEIYNHPTRETIHVGNNVHVLDQYGSFMNHSFTPSTCVNGFEIVALIDIKKNDELTFNYNDSEINMANVFEINGVLVCGQQYIPK